VSEEVRIQITVTAENGEGQIIIEEAEQHPASSTQAIDRLTESAVTRAKAAIGNDLA